MKLAKYLNPCSPEKSVWESCPCYGCTETRATVEQGINDILLECERLEFPVELEQTGGMVMCVSVDLPDPSRYLLFSLWGMGVYSKDDGDLLAEVPADYTDDDEKQLARRIARLAHRIFWQARGYQNAISALEQEEFTEHAEILKNIRKDLKRI